MSRSEWRSCGKMSLRGVLKRLVTLALVALLVIAGWLWLPTTVRYHVTERYRFRATDADSQVFLGIMLPRSGPYQRVEDLAISWDGNQSLDERPEIDVAKLAGDVRHTEAKLAVISYDVVLWQGRPRWDEPVNKWKLQPQKHIESDAAVFAEKAAELTSGQSRDDAFRVFDFASRSLSSPKGNRTTTGDASPSALRAYETGEGVCGEFANLTVALCRAAKIPSKSITGVGLKPLPPFWSSSSTWNHPGVAHAWVELHTEAGWEMADPSAASLIPCRPWNSLWFGRSHGCHLSYGEMGRHERIYNEIRDWASARGKIVGAMSAPNRFVAAATASRVSITPQVTIRMGFSDWRWSAILALVVLRVTWRIRKRFIRRHISDRVESSADEGQNGRIPA